MFMRSRADEIVRALPLRDGVVPMYLGGRWRLGEGGTSRQLFDPANGEPIASATQASEYDAHEAIACAREAFDDGPWPQMHASERAELLLRVAGAIDAAREDFTRIETLNNGKPVRESESDAVEAANCFRYYAGLATKPHGQSFDVPAPSQSFTVREPIGVCALIVPWNYPLLSAAWKLAPALAAGNVCVLKPAEITPLTALRLAAIFEELEFPSGVVNVLTGKGSTIGQVLAESDRVDKIAFTGSTQVGRGIMQAASGNLKKIALELGGKSPIVVFDDADFEIAVDHALYGIFCNTGQVCSAGSRLLVQRSLHDRFVERLVERAQKIRIGDGFDPQTEMGPLTSSAQLETVENYVKIGREEGARLVCGGARLGGALAAGNFYTPTIFDHTKPTMRVVREEIFGPVLVVQTFEDEADAVRLANDSVYGLAGGVFTNDVAKAHRVARKLRAGITWINTYHWAYNEAPWGGYKQSGIGRELGTYGYDA
ncbi:MAG TPA: aldehyde dehydrogenase family protein, partial [Candidatus Baltobacteraceae bacterium]|nr:aldehyde dehydrogenase family protein [Candidatus Baltobacteraceae bacterium]